MPYCRAALFFSGIDNMNFNQMMIHFCAPTFCNIKPGNLFFVQNKIFSKSSFEEWKKDFLKLGLMIFSHKLSETSTAVLVVNVPWASKILSDAFVKEYLADKGYDESDIFAFLKELFSRMKRNRCFPHEVGFVLGYPVNDVIEFESHKGHDCKFCGYWKTYSDVETARRCLCEYKACMGMCEAWYGKGYTLSQIVAAYKKLSAA